MKTLIEPLIKAFGWGIVNSIWQSALIYAVLFIVLLSLPKMKAKYKHNLAFIAIVLMFIGFCSTFLNHIDKKGTKLATVIADTNELYTASPTTNLISKIEHYFPLVVGFYLLGVILQIFVIAKGYNKLNQLRNQNTLGIPAAWKNLFEKTLTHLEITKKVKFYLSSAVNVPMVIGYLKPVVLFPIALVNQLSNDQVEAILIHELSHIRRNDFLLNLIKTTIETLLFFNPFVWLAGKFINIEREHACDDLVIKITGQPLKYAQTLLKLEILKEGNHQKLAMAATGNGPTLYHRIKRITNMKTNYLNVKQQMAALTLGLACLCSIAWVSPTEKEQQKTAKNKIKLSAVKPADSIKTVNLIDTAKKRKIQIIIKDGKGKQTVYHSINEMPDSLKQLSNIKFFGPDLQKQIEDATKQSLKIKEYFDSPEWKKEQIAIKKQAEEIRIQMNSPEWKKENLEITQLVSNPQFLAEMEALKGRIAKLDTKKIVELALPNKDSLANAFRIELFAPSIFNEEKSNKKLRESEEYKKLKEKFDDEVKALKEKIEKKTQK